MHKAPVCHPKYSVGWTLRLQDGSHIETIAMGVTTLPFQPQGSRNLILSNMERRAKKTCVNGYTAKQVQQCGFKIRYIKEHE